MTDSVVRRLIKPDGKVEVLGDLMSMGQISILLGAESVGVVNLHNGMVMLLDDNGIGMKLPVNPIATGMYLRRAVEGCKNQVYGDVVIVPDADFSEYRGLQ